MSKQLKKWYRSKSIWFALLAVATAAIDGYSGGDWRTAALAGFGAVAILLRALTKEGIIL